MLEIPNIQDDKIIACLHDDYQFNVTQLEFLPIGADLNTGVYRAITDDATPYFVKLRSGDFDEMTITVPKRFHDQGVKNVITPLSTMSHELWTQVDDFVLVVFPYIDGRDGYNLELQDHHWVEFGRALKAIHTATLPDDVIKRVQREVYSPQWRDEVRHYMNMVNTTSFTDPVSIEMATLLRDKQDIVHKLVNRAEYLAGVLKTQTQPFILCHADIHAGNLLIDANDQLYIVDWDTLIFAPKERDLMFVGGGQFVNQRSPEQEEMLFYQGYGQTEGDAVGLAYYRYERIVQDIASFCDEILMSEGNNADRANGLRFLVGQFQPGHVIDIAFRSEALLPVEHR